MELPFVSVVVPVFNAENKIGEILLALENQSYPPQLFEIIVVDNGSTDHTPAAVEAFTRVKLFHANEVNNPYFARNKGIRESSGEIIVFLDVNCTPNTDWLRTGVQELLEKRADLIGGEVKFAFSKEKSLAQWYDSITFVDMKKMINNDHCCAAGNLFVRHKVIEAIGIFPEEARSGGDLRWTKKATDQGFSLLFSQSAYVDYPAREIWPLMRKSYRVGTGHPRFWKEQGKSAVKIIAIIFYNLIPSTPKALKKRIDERGIPEMNDHLVQLWIIEIMNKISLAMGRLKGFFNDRSN